MKIFVKVKTKAKQKKILKIDDTHFEISTNVPPEDGKANKEIMKLLAKYFDTSVSKVFILSGDKSKNKIIEII
jgi:uncharacterized protein (TIGR00251 family)